MQNVRYSSDRQLDDVFINDYLDIIRNEYKHKSNSIYCFNTFAFTLLTIHNESHQYDRMNRLCKKLPDLTKFKKLIIPINVENIHWKLIVVSLKSRMLFMYDSMEINGGFDVEYDSMAGADHIRRFLNFYGSYMNYEPFITSPWLLVSSGLYSEGQRDAVNCGAYVLIATEAQYVVEEDCLVHDITVGSIKEERFLMQKSIQRGSLVTPFLNRSINIRRSMIQKYERHESDIRDIKGKRIVSIRQPSALSDPFMDRQMVSAREKFLSNSIIWDSKLNRRSEGKKHQPAKNIFALRRDQFMWSRDSRLFKGLQDSTEEWLGRLVSRGLDDKGHIWIISIIDDNAHTWRDHLVFERLILEQFSRKRPNCKVHICVVSKYASGIYKLGKGLCALSQDYPPNVYESCAGRNSVEMRTVETIESRKRKTESDSPRRKDRLDKVVKYSIDEATKAVSDMNIDKDTEECVQSYTELNDETHGMLCLNDSIYSISTTFPSSFVDFTVFNSVSDVLSDFSNGILPNAHIVISTKNEPCDEDVTKIRTDILRKTGGQFIWLELRDDESSRLTKMILRVQKARSTTFNLSSRTKDMSESSEDDRNAQMDDVFGSDSDSIMKRLYPVYEGERIKCSSHAISLQTQKYQYKQDD